MVSSSASIRSVSAPTLRRLNRYVQDQWDNLTRDVCSPQAFSDTKTSNAGTLYLPPTQPPPRGLPPALVISTLPTVSAALSAAPGLLYLPNQYVVPGGRFNEQYGWDTYFTVRGLLCDGHTAKARGMVDNLLYEVEHYGRVLNANRSYYLGRSSPPLLGQSVLAVYQETGDREWLKKALPLMMAEHDTWIDDGEFGHRTANGLSRYASSVAQPCPEVEPGYYSGHPTDATFYRHDRAERECGWDMTDRFGYRCMDYNPVDLNCLLVQSEKDIAEAHRIVHGPDSGQARHWDDLAASRAGLVRELMWSPQQGMFFDHDHVHGKRSSYPTLATFVPLWTGVATDDQARQVRDNLPLFEQQGGLATSAHVSGKQWDAPYGWAPLQIMAAEGLRRYHYDDDAARIEGKFLNCVANEFERSGNVLEKYDVVRGSGDAEVGYGNQIGFGWTNAAVRLFSKNS